MFNYMLSNIKKPVFRPLKTIASALWHLLLSPPAFAIPPFGFSSLPSGVYYFVLLPILRHLPSCLPVFTSPPSSGFCSPLRCLLFCFSGSATLIQHLLFHLLVCCPIFHHLLFSLPAFVIPPAFLLLWSFVQKSPHLRPCLTDKRMCF